MSFAPSGDRVRQGEVRLIDGARSHVLIMTGDAYLGRGRAHVVPISRQGVSAFPYMIKLAEQDPLSGYVEPYLIAHLGEDLIGEPVAMLTGATIERVREALATLFGPSPDSAGIG